MESSSSPPPPPSSLNIARQESKMHNKRIKQQQSKPVDHNNKIKTTAWKYESTQRVYATKLLRALSRQRGGTVRLTADRVLAAAARGKTRWSRAILTNRVQLRLLHKKYKRRMATAATEARRPPKKARCQKLNIKAKNMPSVQRKIKILGRLVPGCRKESLPVIVEEATDYIPALEMQIRAMRDILSRLSIAGAGNVIDESSSLELPVPENGVV